HGGIIALLLRTRADAFSFQHTHAMGFAVAYVEHPGRGYEDAVRARHFAMQRIAVGAVAALARAGDGGDRARLQIDAANGVILRARYVQAAVRRARDPFRSVEPGTL